MAFDWLKRKKKTAPRPKRRLPQRHLAPVEEIVEQGLMVADVAVRMNVKNAIILNALGRKADYDKQQITRMVQDATLELAVERERDARHIARMRGEIKQTGFSTWSENDYGSDDNATLRHRQEVYEQVAAQLRERADNEEYLDEAAERARTAAWNEVGDSLKEKASHPYYAGGSSEEYKRERDSRIDLLIQRDLTELMKQHASSGENGGSKRRIFSKRNES
ncbi:asparagine synthase [Leucobacter sp. UT-8R-CII-1-4]|uniref:asparagine synthase n=1 Tax=Leucobacter sp. UT-8R-CII-1-4 TaxID=3040075 RepID=UPI0024A7BBDE|nr:asparagine synthase [Leucobacter sp. UT-8R-CII-1-4]MDI6023339.1 asparagine synthase [Leucobacter sp. UT-8R-CII-1-4]